jgi:hypothetical protein
MDADKNPAVERLYKKFAALRATLPTDERDIFDQVIPAEDEVTGHRMIQRRVARRAIKGAAEVEAHRLAKRPTRAKAKKAAEVEAHKFTVKKPAKRPAKKPTR